MNSTLTDVSSFINSLSTQGAAWYQGITGTPVLAGTIAASTSTTSPFTSGLLANPWILVVGLVIIGIILYLALR